MKSRSRQLAGIALLAGLVASLLPLAAPAQQPTTAEGAFRRVSDQLICQCGCNYVLSFCPHLQCPSAPKLRASIREKLAAGMSEKQVLDAMVADFGPAVLAAPPREGFNWTAWVMPFVALLLGLVVVQQVIRRWRARPSEPPPEPAVLDRYRKSIERDIKSLEE